MFHDGAEPGDQTVVPFLFGRQLFLTPNTSLNDSAEDTSVFKPLLAFAIHIGTVSKNTVLFILGQVIEVL